MNNKDTIYIDIDDEITAIIDKVQNASNKIVALVLPKRATVLQSIVNMKLLKRSAETAKKQVVLITSEAGLLPLAASVGFYVASTLQSKPVVPSLEEAADNLPDEVDEPVRLEDFDTKANADKPIGELDGDDEPASSTEEPESIDLNEADADGAPVAAAAATGAAKSAKTAKPKLAAGEAGKKLSVPNFLRFRKWFILAIAALILLIGGGYVAAVVLPKANITITADASTVVVDKTLTLSTQQQTVSSNDGLLPASIQQTDKKNSQQVSATGSKNNGAHATGKVLLKYCPQSWTLDTFTVKTGDVVSANSKNFVITVDGGSAKLNPGSFGGACTVNGSTSTTVSITAVEGGSSYNGISSGSWQYAKSGDITGQTTSGGTTAGGDDNLITVVQQSDIDKAKQQMSASTSDNDAAKSELQQKLGSAGFQAILETFTAASPVVTSSANVGDQADTVTVTQTVTYKMFGVKRDDLAKLVADNANQKIDTSKQSILDNGLNQATYSLVGTPSDSSAQIKFRSQAMAGPKLDVNALKSQLAGKKSGQVQDQLKALPGIQNVNVKFSPFWVTSVPKNANKVTVNFQQVTGGTNGQ